MEIKKFVDIDKLLSEKNPKFKKWAPGFLVTMVKNIIHQDFVNDFMWRNRDKFGADFCEAVIDEMNITVIAHGVEHIPLKGGCYLVSNHPLGGMDAMATVHALKDKRPDLKFIVNDVLLKIDGLKSMFYGVNKHGKSASESLKKINELFAGEEAVFIFPAGLVSRRKSGIVKDVEWRKTFITRAKRNNQPIVPVHIDGQLSNFFYTLANARTKIGIKANIEMLFLVSEMRKQTNKTIEIYFGEPIDPATFDKSKTDKEWADWVKEKSYNLSSI